MSAKKRVLILCTGNSARSQMAEGLLRRMAGDRLEIFSAGTRPAGLHPEAVAAMAEIGIDISGQRSKSVEEFRGEAFDCVMTVCDGARESCPVFAGPARRFHQDFEDPAAAPADGRTAVFRRVRDELRAWLAQLASELAGAANSGTR